MKLKKVHLNDDGISRFQKFWSTYAKVKLKECDAGGPNVLQDFAHPDDKGWLEKLEKQNPSLIARHSNWESYVKSSDFYTLGKSHSTKRIHLSLPPTPYVGNLAGAKVVLLLLNPGCDRQSYWAHFHIKNRAVDLLESLEMPEERRLLDPAQSWSAGYKYALKTWSSVVREVAKQKKMKDSALGWRDAVDLVGENVAVLQLFPYPSLGKPSLKVKGEVPESVNRARLCAQALIAKAEKKQVAILVGRSIKDWFPDEQNFKNSSKRHPQNILIGKNPRNSAISSEHAKIIAKALCAG